MTSDGHTEHRAETTTEIAALLRASERRFRFLADASATLAESLDYDTTLDAVAHIAVPTIADWCTVIVEEDGVSRRIAAVHKDPSKHELLEAYKRGFPPNEHRSGGVANVLQTRKAFVQKTVADADLVAAAQSPEHLRILRGLGCVSCVIAPMHVPGKLVGVISLMLCEENRTFSDEDVSLLEELARRAALAVENARLYKDLEAAVRIRDDFLAMAGHELKTPLAVLLLHVQGAQLAARKDPAVTKFAERLGKAVASGERLDRLIDELLDVSRITAGKFRLETEPLDLAVLVREGVESFADAAAKAACLLEVRTAPEVHGAWDRSRIAQILTNLIGNAVKYGRGKPIEVVLDVEPPHAILRVIDHGVGIEPDQQKRIFERFERAVPMREFGGFGLGLWIVKQIVEACGGTIAVESERGHGATFLVRLPLAPPAAAQSASSSTEQTNR